MIFWYFKYVKKDLWRKILTENFDSRDEHCFYIKLNTAIILVFNIKNGIYHAHKNIKNTFFMHALTVKYSLFCAEPLILRQQHAIVWLPSLARLCDKLERKSFGAEVQTE